MKQGRERYRKERERHRARVANRLRDEEQANGNV